MLVRLVSKPPYRWTLYVVFMLAAAAAFVRASGGHSVQVLPAWGALFGLYGAWMALISRDLRCRLIYASFGVVVALAFGRGLVAGWIRPASILEVLCCIALVLSAAALSRDDEMKRRGAVLESGAIRS